MKEDYIHSAIIDKHDDDSVTVTGKVGIVLGTPAHLIPEDIITFNGDPPYLWTGKKFKKYIYTSQYYKMILCRAKYRGKNLLKKLSRQ